MITKQAVCLNAILDVDFYHPHPKIESVSRCGSDENIMWRCVKCDCDYEAATSDGLESFKNSFKKRRTRYKKK